MMNFSWTEVEQQFKEMIQSQDFTSLAPLLDNVKHLNSTYNTSTYGEPLKASVQELSTLCQDTPCPKEQISAKMIALNQQINSIIHNKIKPRMFAQKWLFDKMKALNYKVTGLGECCGISHMACQAFLAHDMETFNQRLNIIHDQPLEVFNDDFKIAREEIARLLKEGKITEANQIRDTITDIYAFFDGITLYQQPDIYLHDDNIQPLSTIQDSTRTLPVTMPVSLQDSPNQPVIIDSFYGKYQDHQ